MVERLFRVNIFEWPFELPPNLRRVICLLLRWDDIPGRTLLLLWAWLMDESSLVISPINSFILNSSSLFWSVLRFISWRCSSRCIESSAFLFIFISIDGFNLVWCNNKDDPCVDKSFLNDVSSSIPDSRKLIRLCVRCILDRVGIWDRLINRLLLFGI